jgi:DNA-binding IclR family transcriptional regulator
MSDIANGLEILSHFTPSAREISCRRMSELTHLPRCTTNRLLTRLEAGGFVVQMHDRRYRLATDTRRLPRRNNVGDSRG